jgi:hypothetical protein
VAQEHLPAGGNPGADGTSFVAENALALAILWPVVLIAPFMTLSVRRYRGLRR